MVTLLACLFAVGPSGSKPLSGAEEARTIARSFLREGFSKAEVRCLGPVALVQSPAEAAGPGEPGLRYPSWVVQAWGWFELRPRPGVVDSADGVRVFVDARSGEAYGFAFNGGPGLACRLGRCNGMERLFQPCGPGGLREPGAAAQSLVQGR